MFRAANLPLFLNLHDSTAVGIYLEEQHFAQMIQKANLSTKKKKTAFFIFQSMDLFYT